MNEAEIRTRLSELRAKQEAAPGWGAAVGARQEEIKELEGQLLSLTVSLPVTGLLPCPFCGEAAMCRESDDDVSIMCGNDKCWTVVGVPATTKERAVKVWNTRPGPAQGPGLREAFRNADAKDWGHLDLLLGHGGHGKFWRAVFEEVRAALPQPGAVEPSDTDAIDWDEMAEIRLGQKAANPPALDPAQSPVFEALKLAHKALTPFALSPGAISLSSALGHIERQHLLDAVQAIEAIQATLSAPNPASSTPSNVAPGFTASWDEELTLRETMERGASNADTSTVPTSQKSAPEARCSLPSGESDPSVTLDYAGADTYPEAATVCAELYQVIGSLADHFGVFEHEDVQRALDNASEHKLVHKDLLPWPRTDLPNPVPQTDGVQS